MRKKQVFLALLLAAVVVFGQGCKTTMIGHEGQVEAVYSFGKLKSTVPAGINSTYQAVETAMDQLELVVSKKTKDALSAEVIARDSRDKKVTIKLLAVAEDNTQLSIKAGGAAKARLIYQKINENLK